MQNFKDIKISQKLGGSYAIIIILVIILSAISFGSMVKLKNVFSEYQSTAQTSLLLSEMSRYLGNARREIFSYRAAPDDTKQKIIENNINNLLALAPKIEVVTVG